ncbi:LamG domain-containing protein [uncultured Psychroserpens sp.]|uniref:LamG domain-containing protein n=1 Tax=uncultured Psychroserpens sp. TaxID=255436 RepID=UPI0026361B53|nr:LamG domain-containing protein [uncultured Psychroserpens sp.]
MKTTKLLFLSSLFFLLITMHSFAQKKTLKDHVLFYSSFDGKASADIAIGDAQIYTAESYKNTTNAKAGLHDSNVVLAKGKGLVGDAIHFKEAKTSAIFYKAYKNVGYSSTSWSGTISFWLRLDPNKELASHYCDPICITDSKWSDAGLWVDFTDHNPRQFRYGAMGDLAVWDPNNDSDDTDWNKRTVTVNPAPFQSKTWTHVAMVFSKVNTKTKSEFKLYLNAKIQGVIKDINDPFTWEPKNGKIMLGLGYIGFMDELAVFDKALSPDEIKTVYELKSGLKAIFF